MATNPKHTTKTVTRHEWHIGDEYEESSFADVLRDGLHFAQQEMMTLGVDIETGDAFRWRAGDGAMLILYVDIEDEHEK